MSFDSSDCSSSPEIVLFPDDSSNDSEAAPLTKIDCIMNERRKRWHNIQTKHQYRKNIVTACGTFSEEFIERVSNDKQCYGHFQSGAKSEVEMLYSRRDVKLYLSKYLVVQIYYKVRELSQLKMLQTSEATALYDIIVKLTHSEVTDPTCCLILKYWVPDMFESIGKDILLIIAIFSYDTGTVYDDIVHLVEEYRDSWMPTSFIDEPYILGANNWNAATAAKSKDSDEGSFQLFSDDSDTDDSD